MTTVDLFSFIVFVIVMLLNSVLVFGVIFFFLKGLITDDRNQFSKMMIAVGVLILINLLQWFSTIDSYYRRRPNLALLIFAVELVHTM
jgi:hypothetical protein